VEFPGEPPKTGVLLLLLLLLLGFCWWRHRQGQWGRHSVRCCILQLLRQCCLPQEQV
jgi:hypothetical protein